MGAKEVCRFRRRDDSHDEAVTRTSISEFHELLLPEIIDERTHDNYESDAVWLAERSPLEFEDRVPAARLRRGRHHEVGMSTRRAKL
jgi:hypothetical protein